MQAFSSMRKTGHSNDERERARPRIGPGFFALVLTLAVTAAAAERGLAIDAPYAAAVLAVFCAGAVVVLRQASLHLPARRFGAANRVTSLRGALAALAAGLLLARPGVAAAWCAVAIAVPALVLDGVDGALARRQRLASAFGARFDMEIDALTILILSALAWRFDRAGGWVLAGGLARYTFVAAGRAWPWLRRPLPRSRRRQTACVVQAAALVACLAPIVHPLAAAGVAALGVAGVAASFAVDILWLRRASRSLAPLAL